MCDLVREQHAGAPQRGGATQPPGLGRLRPRWAGAVAAVLIGGLALATLVDPPSASSLAGVKDPGAPAPLASRAAAVPTAGVVEQRSALVDDGVPSPADVTKAGAGHCEHGL